MLFYPRDNDPYLYWAHRSEELWGEIRFGYICENAGFMVRNAVNNEYTMRWYDDLRDVRKTEGPPVPILMGALYRKWCSAKPGPERDSVNREIGVLLELLERGEGWHWLGGYGRNNSAPY